MVMRTPHNIALYYTAYLVCYLNKSLHFVLIPIVQNSLQESRSGKEGNLHGCTAETGMCHLTEQSDSLPPAMLLKLINLQFPQHCCMLSFG